MRPLTAKDGRGLPVKIENESFFDILWSHRDSINFMKIVSLVNSVARNFRRMIGFPKVPLQLETGSATVKNATGRERRLFVDVTEYFRFNCGTGIQRITNACISYLNHESPSGFQVVFCFVDGAGRFRAVDDVGLNFREGCNYKEIDVHSSDVFFFLDFSPRLLPKRRAQLNRWRLMDVRMIFLVHDFLPSKHPEWFTARGVKNFNKWTALLVHFGDQFLCLSDYTRRDLQTLLLNERGFLPSNVISKIHLNLGWNADPKNKIKQAVDLGQSRPIIIMVGTIEPRKGHAQVLRAFDELWAKNFAVDLIFAGRSGWRTTELQNYMRSHRLREMNFHWKDSVTDSQLMALYRSAAGVIVASEDEGFGLPLREALHCGKPVLARDIPVFRENVEGDVTYFRGESSQLLAKILEEWISKISLNAATSWSGEERSISYAIRELDPAIFDAVH